MTRSDILAMGKEGLIKPPLFPFLAESPSGAVTSHLILSHRKGGSDSKGADTCVDTRVKVCVRQREKETRAERSEMSRSTYAQRWRHALVSGKELSPRR